MKQIIKWMMAGSMLLASGFVVVFLPEYMADRKDGTYLGQYQLYAQETFDTDSTDLSIADKLDILTSDVNWIEVLGTRDKEEVMASDSDLFIELQKQLSQLEERELLPNLRGEIDLENTFEDAVLYAITKPGKIFYMWCMNFDQIEGDVVIRSAYYVDAVTYKVYEANVYSNSKTIMDYIENAVIGSDEPAVKWMLEYADYLLQEDGMVWIVNSEISNSQMNFYGTFENDGFTYDMECHFEYDTKWEFMGSAGFHILLSDDSVVRDKNESYAK